MIHESSSSLDFLFQLGLARTRYRVLLFNMFQRELQLIHIIIRLTKITFFLVEFDKINLKQNQLETKQYQFDCKCASKKKTISVSQESNLSYFAFYKYSKQRFVRFNPLVYLFELIYQVLFEFF